MHRNKPAILLFVIAGAVVLTLPDAEAKSRTRLQATAEWSAQIDDLTNDATKLIARTEKLDALSRRVAGESLEPEDARLRGATIISDLRTRLAKIRERARALPPPPVMPNQAVNKANQSKRAYVDKLVDGVARLLETSVSIYDAAIEGKGGIEKQLYLKFSHQMIVLLESENETNRAAIASQPRDPLHPQYHLLSCIVETNEAMKAIWRAIIDVSHGQDAARIHARMQRRILQARSRIRQLAKNGRGQVKVYRTHFRKGEKSGRFPKAQVDLLNRMMDTYAPSYEVEEKIAAALVAYSELPNMAEQTDAHRQKAEDILGSIGPLSQERGRLQARRTRLAGQI